MEHYQREISIFKNTSGNMSKKVLLSEKVLLTAEPTENEYAITRIDAVGSRIAKQIYFHIDGKFTKVSVKGRVSQDVDSSPIAVVDMQKLEAVEGITSAGIFAIPCDGFTEITFDISGAVNASAVARITF